MGYNLPGSHGWFFMPFRHPDGCPQSAVFGLILMTGCHDAPTSSLDTGSSECSVENLSCQDAMVRDLSLSAQRYDGDNASTVQESAVFMTSVDASAGGVSDELDGPWLYLSMGVNSWVSVPISDYEALRDPAWDLALRRGQIRLNSGSSGPGCTTGLPWVGRAWEDADFVPDGLLFFEEMFYDADCALILDNEGLPEAPRLVLDGWWEDKGCLAMTGLVWLIAPGSGGVLKASVERYYADGQEDCDAGRGGGVGGGNYLFRWQWLVEPG